MINGYTRELNVNCFDYNFVKLSGENEQMVVLIHISHITVAPRRCVPIAQIGPCVHSVL